MEKLQKIEKAVDMIWKYNQYFMAYLTLKPSEVKYYPSVGNHADMIKKSVYTLIKDFPNEKLNDHEKEYMESVRENYGIPNLNMPLFNVDLNRIDTFNGLKKVLGENIEEGKTITLREVVELSAKEIEENESLGSGALADINAFLYKNGYEVLK